MSQILADWNYWWIDWWAAHPAFWWAAAIAGIAVWVGASIVQAKLRRRL